MIAFKKEAFENIFLLREAKDLKEMGFVPKIQLAQLSSGLPILKSHYNYLIRFGFFLLGNFMFSSIVGLFSLFFASSNFENYKYILFLYALIAFVAAEFFARKDYYRFGLDDAFILIAQFSICGAVGFSTYSPFFALLTLTVAGLFCCWRYVNTLAALISALGFTGLVADLIVEHKLIDMWFLPFIMFFLAVGIYFAVKKVGQNPNFLFYHRALDLVRGFSLILGYFSVNYLVVRELANVLMHFEVTESNDIPFASLFYALTFIIPVFYIVYSLRIKDKTMMNIGFLTFAFSIFTIRYYYAVMPLENALILGGIILFGLSYFFIRKLKDKPSGITFQKDRGGDKIDLLNAEALIVSSQLDLHPQTSADQNVPFGGGGFSGGGAGEEY